MNEQEDLNSNKSSGVLEQKISRRKALKLGLTFLTLPLILKDTQDPDTNYASDFSKELKKHANTRFYYHNAADNPETFKKALKSSAENIEIDVVNVNGKLFVAHSLDEFRAMSENTKKGQDFELIVNQVIAAGKNPAFDLKISGDDKEGFSLFKGEVETLVPKDRLATFSGGTLYLLDEIESSKNRIIAYTLNKNLLPQYYQRAAGWLENGTIGRGATVEYGSDIMDEVLEFNNQAGVNFPTNVWSVDSYYQVLDSLRRGASGITTDSEQIIKSAASVVTQEY